MESMGLLWKELSKLILSLDMPRDGESNWKVMSLLGMLSVSRDDDDFDSGSRDDDCEDDDDDGNLSLTRDEAMD